MNNKNRQIFVNLPVKDLEKSIEFFTKIGFTFNPKFTDQNATCMIISENIYVMLLVEDFFKTFIKKEISNSHTTTEAILAITAASREEVDLIINKAIAAGGTESKDPENIEGMYGWGFQDLDGHLWEFFFMEEG